MERDSNFFCPKITTTFYSHLVDLNEKDNVAQLYFYYSAMNAGKSTTLLQSAFNYKERGMNPAIFTTAIDNRSGVAKVSSRIGIEEQAHVFHESTNLFESIKNLHDSRFCHCVLIDECQFMSKKQVYHLTDVVDKLCIPTLCYGLKTDFRGELFEGSQYLLAWADKLIELKTLCHCGRKANMVVRIDSSGEPVTSGRQVEIGGNERYISMCRRHFKDSLSRGSRYMPDRLSK